MPLFGRRSVEPAEQQRKKIYSEEEIKERLESMDPEMQNTFIRLAEMLMHKESQMFLNIVAKSRQDIQEVGESIREEQEVLKTTAKILARERSGLDGLQYADVDEEESQTKVHYESEYNKKVVQDYLKAVGRDVPSNSGEVQKRRNYKLAKTDVNGYVPEYARRVGTAGGAMSDRPYTASGSRPGTAYRMRMSRQQDEEEDAAGAVGGIAVNASWQAEPTRQRERTMEEDAKVKEEKEELMEQMKMMDNMMLGEKARQQEAMQARKEARKARKEQKKADEETQAMELMETNQEAEEQKRKSKERQEQILKERLAKKRLERRKTLQDMESEDAPSRSTASHVPAEERAQELERELGITRAKTSLAPSEDAAEQPKKKGGRKKKQPAEAEAEPPAPVEANWDVVSGGDEAVKKTKKKQPNKAEQPALTPEAETAAADDGKKMKKKKKAPAAAVEPPAADDTVLNLEVGDGAVGAGERKKGGRRRSSLTTWT